jgi:Undecaprenyl-phosphate galactose phosphotransferase WbaP
MQRIPIKSQYRSTFPEIKSGFFNNHAYQIKACFFSLSDLAWLGAVLVLITILRFPLQGKEIPAGSIELLLFLVLAWCLFFTAGLYRTGISPVQELRHLTLAISVFFLLLGGFSVFIRNFGENSLLFLGLGWFLSIIALPLGREITRNLFSRRSFWSEPVVIIGYGPAGFDIAEYLVDNPRSGLYPVVVVDRRNTDRGKTPRVPVIRASDILEHPEMVDLFKTIHTAVLVTNEINDEFLTLIVDEKILRFRHLILVPSSQPVSHLWARPFMIGEMLGFEMGQNLVSRRNRTIKRVFDLLIVLLTLPVTLPLCLLLAILIKLDSPGKVFHERERLGYQNRVIKVLEFRTSFSNPTARKSSSPAPKTNRVSEAGKEQKEIPRITRFGKILRWSGLYHLPQIIQVLQGEMSLIGPAPIQLEESKSYGQSLALYSHVLPGMTGLWQVSNHDELSSSTRVHLDEYYIRNWSIWLDLYILFRTAMILFDSKRAERLN